jgi:RND family efflux transporter MFP subunit
VDDLFRLGLTNAAWATALALAATIGAWFCRRRPAIVHVLWLLVLVKLVTPSVTQVALPAAAAISVPPGGRGPVESGLAGGETLTPTMHPGGRGSTRLSSPKSARAADGNGEGRTSPGYTAKGATPENAHGPLVRDRERIWTWRAAVAILWLAGVLTWSAIVGLNAYRFRRLLRSARPAPADLTDRTTRVAARLGLHHVPAISLVPAHVPPMLWASLAGRPHLILPEELWVRFEIEQQDAVLAHELAHLKRRDHWVRRLEAIVLGLYWWYPGAWWARRQLERAEEECCDAWVVWALPTAASSYAEALLATAVFLTGLRQPLPLGASSAGRTLPLKRRLNMILRDQSAGSVVRSAPRFVLLAGAFALPFLPVLTRGQQAGAPGSVAPASAQPPAVSANATASPSKTDGKASEGGFVFKFEEVALDPKKPDEKVRVRFCQPIVREVSDYVDVMGRLEAAHTVQLRARVSGTIVRVSCRLGQTVKVDDILFEIDRRSYQAEFDKAEAEVRRAQSRMKRCEIKLATTKSLFENKHQIISQSEVHLYEAELTESEAALGAATADRDLAKLKLDSTEVRSPIAGTVSGSVLDAGSVITADTTDLTTIVALDPMYVAFDLDETTVLRLKSEGKKQPNAASAPLVTVRLTGEAETARNGQFSLADLRMQGNGEVRCRTAISNKDGFLFPGLSARVRVATSAPHKVFLVPGTAVARGNNSGHQLFFLDQKNAVERRRIGIGLPYDDLQAVNKGVRAGDWVVADLQSPAR